MNRSHSAKYLVLLGEPSAPRALLFNGQHDYLSEVIDDDGLLLDGLVQSSRRCPTPRELSFDALGTAVLNDGVRCFALDD